MQENEKKEQAEKAQTKKHWQELAPGKILFNYGPTTMVVLADKKGEPLTDLIIQAFDIIDSSLTEITKDLPKLKHYPGDIDPETLGRLPKKMLDAVLRTGDPTLTPMAAVAGCISDEVADWIFEQGATRVMVNNGGDVALRLAPGENVKLGIVTSLKTSQMDRVVNIKAEDGIGGICTSGLGGRSFTRGIADGVTVFSSRCIFADAMATHIANCSYVETENIARIKAKHVDPNTDIPELEVVLSVEDLKGKEIKQSLKQIDEEVMRQKKKGNLIGCCAKVGGRMLDISLPENEKITKS